MMRRGSSKTTPSQPGSRGPDSSEQKREFRDLNTRLELYVRTQQERQRAVDSLKAELQRQELEFKQKLKEQQRLFDHTEQRLRGENEQLTLRAQSVQDELDAAVHKSRELEERLACSEKLVNEEQSRADGLNAEIAMYKTELDALRKKYASIKFQYQNHDSERTNLLAQLESTKDKYQTAMHNLTVTTSDLKSTQEAFSRVTSEHRLEVEELTKKLRDMELAREELQDRLRTEFDTKLKDYISKREEGYQQEKAEWVRIFKEEFNRKLRSFKDANFEMQQQIEKHAEEMQDVRSRLAQLKQNKAEVERIKQSLEQELEKVRHDLDHLRETKEAELKQKSANVLHLRDLYKKKELEYDELLSVKVQLFQEIELYRKILLDAETSAGYNSPFSSGHRGARKKRKLNDGEPSYLHVTPGLARATKTARLELNRIQMSTIKAGKPHQEEDEDEDMKEQEDSGSRKGPNPRRRRRSSDDFRHGADDTSMRRTPGEAFPLQFSTMDLSESMLEIQNVSEEPVALRGYALSNRDMSSLFRLPKHRVLQPNETLRVVIGADSAPQRPDDVVWPADVWSGEQEDVARLLDPQHHEIARIEIHPDMLPAQVKSGCFVM